MQTTELREGESPTKTEDSAVALRRSVSATDASPGQAKSTMRAIGVVLARQARQMAEATATTANDVIDLWPRF